MFWQRCQPLSQLIGNTKTSFAGEETFGDR